jgi:hypothetical protein
MLAAVFWYFSCRSMLPFFGISVAAPLCTAVLLKECNR